MLLYDGQIAAISGASSGIGRATALLGATEGLGGITVHGRNEERANAVAEEIRGKGVKAHVVIGDLSEVSVAQRLVSETVEQFGRIDVLINNAGCSDRSTIDDLTPEFADWIMKLNFFAPMFATQAAVKAFVELGINGSVLNNGSVNALCGQGNLLAYSASKAALRNYTQTLGHELGVRHAAALANNEAHPWIRVNAFDTGWIASDGETRYKRQETPDAPDDWYETPPLDSVPRGKMNTVEEAAQQFLFLASNKACGNINAQVWTMEQWCVGGPPNRSLD